MEVLWHFGPCSPRYGPIIVAVSARTALAVRMADAAGMTLVAIARKDGFEVFTHPRRVKGALTSHVA